MATWVGGAVHTAAEWLILPLDWLPSWITLLVVTVLTGGVALWVVKMTTNQENLVRARHRMAAAVYEMRLFLDEPRRIAYAQVRLVRSSLAYTAQTLPGLVVLAVPFGLVYVHLELRYGWVPHAAGSEVTLGVEVKDPSTASAVRVQNPHAGVEIDLGPVIAEREGRVYHRLRVKAAGTHRVRVRADGQSYDKLVVAAPDSPVSIERVAGIAHAWAASTEPALDSSGPVTRIWVDHVAEDETWLGLPWWFIWLAGSVVAALLLRRPLRAEL